jgi:hypothetical protein
MPPMPEIAHLAHVELHTPVLDESVEFITATSLAAGPHRRSLLPVAGADVRGTSEGQGPSRSDRRGACGSTRTHDDARSCI